MGPQGPGPSPHSPSAPPGPPGPRRWRPRGTGPPRSRWRRLARCLRPGDPAVPPGSAPAPALAQHPPASRGGEGSPGQGGSGAGRGRTGTHQRPGPGQATLLPTESVQGLEGGVQAVASRQLLVTRHLDLGLCQRSAQGLLPAQCHGSGEHFPGAGEQHGMARRCPGPGGSTAGPRADLRRSAPGAAAAAKPGRHGGRARRSWCRRSPA